MEELEKNYEIYLKEEEFKKELNQKIKEVHIKTYFSN